jgi:hypothetical protein
MIYLFGKGKDVSTVYAPETLTEQDKKGAIIVDKLPPKENKEGFEAILYLDKNNKPYWEYVEIKQETKEDLVRKGILTKEEYKKLTGKDFTF